MASSPRRDQSPLARTLRRLERAMGAERGERSLWVWVGPFSTVGLTLAALLIFGAANRIDLALSLPMAAVMALFMGALSAFYLSASSADEADARDDDPPSAGPPGPAGDPTGRPVTTPAPAARRPTSAPLPRAIPRQRRPERDPVGAPRS